MRRKIQLILKTYVENILFMSYDQTIYLVQIEKKNIRSNHIRSIIYCKKLGKFENYIDGLFLKITWN